MAVTFSLEEAYTAPPAAAAPSSGSFSLSEAYGTAPASPPAFASVRRGFSRFRQGAAGVGADLGITSPDSAAETIAEQERYQQSIPAPPETAAAMRQMSEAQSVPDFLGSLVKNPGALFSIMGESIGQGGLGMIASIPGAIGGPVGFGAAAGLTSGATEYASSVLDSLRQAGIRLDDPKAVATGLSSPETMAKAREHAAKRGVPVGLFDGLTAGFAGKIMRMAGGPQSVSGFVGRGAGEAGMQAAGGASGEASAQLASEGKISRPGEVALEAIAEIPTGVVETAIGARNAPRGKPAPVEPPQEQGPPVPPLALPPPSTSYGPGFTARPQGPGDGQTIDPADALRQQAETRRTEGPSVEPVPPQGPPLALPMPDPRDEQGNLRGDNFSMAPAEGEPSVPPPPLDALPAPQARTVAPPGLTQTATAGAPRFTVSSPPLDTSPAPQAPPDGLIGQERRPALPAPTVPPETRAFHAVAQLQSGQPVTNRFVMQAAGKGADLDKVKQSLSDRGLIEQKGKAWVRGANPAVSTAPPPAPAENREAAPEIAPPPPAPAPPAIQNRPEVAAPPVAPVQQPVASPPPAPPVEAPKPPRQPIASWHIGNDNVVLPSGKEIGVRYAVVEAPDLVASQDAEGRANPEYPAELQPRDRSRGVSRQQIDEIAQKLNPRLLDKSPKASDGAPIISADGIVESGNGRTLAIRQAYDRNLPTAKAYRDHLAAQGYPVEGMKAPVLVRIRNRDMTPEERQAFTREANERDTLALSATERAMADANAIDDGMIEGYRGGDVDAVQNRPFVRRFIEKIVGKNEAAGMVGPDGQMSQEAVRRIEVALLAKAYGDADLVSALAESPDNNIKAIGGALMDVAPAWTKMRADARTGQIDPEMDTTDRLLEAVKIVQRARKDGRNVIEFVVQNDMLSGTAVDPIAENYLRLMFRDRELSKPTGRDKIADALRLYLDEAGKSSAGAGLFGTEGKATPAGILDRAKERQFGRKDDDQGGLFAKGSRGDGEGERPAGGPGARDAGLSPRARGEEPREGAGRRGDAEGLAFALPVDYPDKTHGDLAAYGLRLLNGGAPENRTRKALFDHFKGFEIEDGLGSPADVDRLAQDYADGLLDEAKRAEKQGEAKAEGWIVVDGPEQIRYIRDKKPTLFARERRPSEPETPDTGETVSWQIAPDLKAEYVAKPEWTQKRSEAADALVDILRQMVPNKRVLLNLADWLTGGEGKEASGVLGAYTSRQGPTLESVISLAMQDPKTGERRSTRDLLKTLNHETLHFLRQTGLLTKPEWNVLVQAAKRQGWMEDYDIASRYGEASEALQIEEAIAEARAAYAVGDLKLPPGLRRIFDKVQQFLDRVKNWMTGNGFQTWQDVMEAIGTGEVGSRNEASGSPKGGTAMHAAWHGSPHDFDEFSLHKIGTGEGAQAYGWGLYFAGRKGVAEHYRDVLRRNVGHYDAMERLPEGRRLAALQAEQDALHAKMVDATLAERGMKPDAAERDSVGPSETAAAPHLHAWRELVEKINAATAAFDEAHKRAERGRLYQVDLAPAEGDYLDWDKPLAEQSEKVRGQIKQIVARVVSYVRRIDNFEADRLASGRLTGRDLYQRLTQQRAEEERRREDGTERGDRASRHMQAGAKAASEALAAAGIPGIRYLDGSSRNKGDGSHNYVIFDDKLVKVTAKFQKADADWSSTLKTERDTDITPEEMNKARGSLFQKQEKGTAQEEEILGRILGTTDKPFGQRAREFLAHWKENIGREFRQGVFDQYDAIAQAEKSLNFGKLMDAAVSAYKRARMLNSGGVIRTLLNDGMVQWDDKAGTWVKRDGFEGGFNAIFEPLAKKGLLRLWQGWAIANRSKRLIQEGRESLLSQSDIDTLLALGEKHPEFKDVQKQWAKFNSATLDMAEQAGVISKEGRALWERSDYVPFFRIMEDESVPGPGQKKGLAGQRSGIKKLEGGEERINDLMMNMVRNISHLVDASMKNKAAQASVELGLKVGALENAGSPQALGDAEVARTLDRAGVDPKNLSAEDRAGFRDILASRQPKTKGGFTVMYDGKPKAYIANDPFFLRSMTSIHWPGFQGFMWDLFGGAKQLLTRSVTAFPDFMLANAMRDSMASWVVTGGKTTPWGAAKGALDSLKDSASAKAIRASGADAVGFYNVDPQARARALKRMDEGRPGRNFLMSWWDKWEQVGKASDNANRLALYDRLIKDGATPAEAAYQAMDLMDFSMKGDAQALRLLTAVVPFMNARLQGLYKLGRAAAENPKAFAIRGGIITAASLALMAANMGDPDYEQIPDQEKDNYYHIKVGDRFFKFPKPFEIGAVFSTVPERLVRYAAGQDEGERLAKRMLHVVTDNLSMDPTPQIVKPMLEQAMNKVGFTGAPIETMAMKNVRPGDRSDNRTSALAKGLGAMAPETISPARVDAFLRGYLGTLGSYIMGASNTIADALSDNARPTQRIEDTAVIGRFFRQNPARSTQYMTDFYDLQDKIGQVAGSIRARVKIGDEEGARALARDNPGALELSRMADRMGDQISQIRSRIKVIQADAKLSGDEKRRQIDGLQERINGLAERAVKTLRQARDTARQPASR